MPIDKEKLDQTLQEGDVEACTALFEGASEAERKKVAKQAIERLRKVTSDIHPRLMSRLPLMEDRRTESFLQFSTKQIHAAQVAVLASASFSQLKGVRRRMAPPPDAAEKVLCERRPPWLQEWVELICDEGTQHWPSIRRLVRLGLCRPPRSDNYILGLILDPSGHSPLGLTPRSSKSCLRDVLLDDEQLLEEDIWRIFDVEPKPGSIQLVALWRQADSAWAWETALARLAAEGK